MTEKTATAPPPRICLTLRGVLRERIERAAEVDGVKLAVWLRDAAWLRLERGPATAPGRERKVGRPKEKS